MRVLPAGQLPSTWDIGGNKVSLKSAGVKDSYQASLFTRLYCEAHTSQATNQTSLLYLPSQPAYSVIQPLNQPTQLYSHQTSLLSNALSHQTSLLINTSSQQTSLLGYTLRKAVYQPLSQPGNRPVC